MGYKDHEGDRCGASATGDAARNALFVRTAGGVSRRRACAHASELGSKPVLLSQPGWVSTHFKDQVFTSETSKDLGAPNPFGGNAALRLMASSGPAHTLEVKRPLGWPSPAALEHGRRKSKSLA